MKLASKILIAFSLFNISAQTAIAASRHVLRRQAD